jgi:hypothetical protein
MILTTHLATAWLSWTLLSLDGATMAVGRNQLQMAKR